MKNYQEQSTKVIMQLAAEGDSGACFELSKRYDKGTPLLDKDAELSEYWMKRGLGVIDESGRAVLVSSEDDAAWRSTTEGKIFLEFSQRVQEWHVSNGTDCIVCFDLGDEAIASIKSGFGVSREERLLFKRDTSFWSSDNQGLVITDRKFYFIPDNNDASQSFELEWQAIENVTYQETKFYFTMHDGTEPCVSWKYFYKGEFPGGERCMKLAKALADIANMVDAIPDAWELFQNGNNEEALASCDILIASSDVDEQTNGHFTKGRILFEIEGAKECDNMDSSKLEESQKELEIAYKLEKNDKNKALIQYWIVPVKLCLGDINIRESIILGMDVEENEKRDEMYGLLQSIEDNEVIKQKWDNFVVERPYKERKFIMPVKDKDIAGCVSDGITVFRLSNLPSCVKFSMGHPVANQLYIGHPYNPELYVPYEESEDLFFVDKVHELCYLLECLGAEEICITSVKGKSVEEMNNLSSNVGGSADIKLFSGEGNVQQDSGSQSEAKDVTKRTMKMVFEPTKKPYVPEGLIWYEEQPQWKRLVQSRIGGNMLEYNEFVSSSSTKFVSSSEKKDVTASARYLWMKVHTDVETEAKSQLRDTEDTQWKVEVRFRSSNLLAGGQEYRNGGASNSDVALETKKVLENNLSENEVKYLEEVRNCLEDGEGIDAHARMFLERLRGRYGVVAERAAEIENMVILEMKKASEKDLLENEAKYLEEVKFCLEDGGEIDERARKFLERLRGRYKITPERAAELENMVMPKLSDEEMEYLEALKEVMADGEISPRDRKLLNRLRDSLCLSEEKAQALENSVQ